MHKMGQKSAKKKEKDTFEDVKLLNDRNSTS